MVTRDEIAGLRAKYGQLLALRAAHERGRTDPDFTEPDPRPSLRELAARWPGALRELDRLTIDTIEARLRELDEVLEEARRPPPWMTAQARFHALARGALAAKMWLSQEPSARACSNDTPSRTQRFRLAMNETTFGQDGLAWEAALEDLAHPPGGRVMILVLARLAEELGISERDARALVFPASPGSPA